MAELWADEAVHAKHQARERQAREQVFREERPQV